MVVPVLNPLPVLAASRVPIVDQRRALGWSQQLPARLGTAGLWLGGALALGPAKLIGLAMAGVVLTPLLLMDRHRAAAVAAAACAGQLAAPGRGLPRAALAAQAGLPELQLFRARHAAICSVHHDAEGRIVGLRVPAPAEPILISSPDAHPVG